MNENQLEEKQANVRDALTHAREIVEALENAEICETATDYIRNIADAQDAIAFLEEAMKELKP